MKICYRDKKFHDKSLALIETCNAIIDELQAQGYKLTLRQLYYQLVSRDIIPNSDKSYDNIGALLSDARLAGLVDWNAIEDRNRFLRGLPHWDAPADIVRGSAQQFNYDLWEDQDVRMEVWVEKEALAGIVGRSSNTYDVPYLSCKGYTSQSEMWGAAQRIVGYGEEGKRTVILHLGDHDPSGIDMTRDIDERLQMFCEYHGQPAPVVLRIALNMDQVRKYNPPPNPAKVTDCRSPKYIAKFGHESWELDALAPKVIDDLIAKHIKMNLDEEKFAAAKERQQKARLELREIAKDYTEVLAEHRAMPQLYRTLEVHAGASISAVLHAVDEQRASLSLTTESLRITTNNLETSNQKLKLRTQEKEVLGAEVSALKRAATMQQTAHADTLREIANIVGGPVAGYSKEVAAEEWSKRAEKISTLIQGKLKG